MIVKSKLYVDRMKTWGVVDNKPSVGSRHWKFWGCQKTVGVKVLRGVS